MTNTATADPEVLNPESRTRSGAHRSLRPVVVAETLAALRGPDSGLVELPQRLARSGGQRVFDMSDIDQVLDMYEAVLGTARTQADLAEYANGELLARLWSEPFLDKGIRKAWEAVHPLLAHPLLASPQLVLGGEVPAGLAASAGPSASDEPSASAEAAAQAGFPAAAPA